MKKKKESSISRRKFLSDTVKTSVGTAIVANLPMIVPASVFGKNAPSNLINVASIGCGRISITHDMTAIARYRGCKNQGCL